MIPGAVDYVRAGSVQEALEALGQPEAKVIAGGQSLLPMMKLRLARPSVVVDVSHLPLGGVATGGQGTTIGALCTWEDLSRSSELRTPALAAIGECAAGVGDLQVRNLGTLGGGLAHGDPASDMPAVILALGAQLRLQSAAGERTVAASDFFVGPFQTALRDDELLLDIAVPAHPAGTGSAYVSVEHPASGFALAGAAAVVSAGGDCSVAVTGVGGRPSLLPAASGDEDGAVAAAVAAAGELDVHGDRYAPPEYRRQLAEVVVRRALARAFARARGEDV